MNVTHQINNPSCLGHYLHTNLSLGKGSGVGWSRLQLLILFGCVILDLCLFHYGPPARGLACSVLLVSYLSHSFLVEVLFDRAGSEKVLLFCLQNPYDITK